MQRGQLSTVIPLRTRRAAAGVRSIATPRRLVSAAGGVAAASIACLIGPDLKAYGQLHRLTRAWAAQWPDGAPDDGPRSVAAAVPSASKVGQTAELAVIERAARGCAVFHRRTADPPAVEICLDSHIWVVSPDQAGTGWLARSRDLDKHSSAIDPLWLPRARGETTVPTLAWARLLAGAPLRTRLKGAAL